MMATVVLVAMALVVCNALRLGDNAIEEDDAAFDEETNVAAISAKLHEVQAELQIEHAKDNIDLAEACLCKIDGVSCECKKRTGLQRAGAFFYEGAWAGFVDVHNFEFCNLENQKNELEQEVADVIARVQTSVNLATDAAALKENATHLRASAKFFKGKVDGKLLSFKPGANDLTPENLLNAANRPKAVYSHFEGLWVTAVSFAQTIEHNVDREEKELARLMTALTRSTKTCSIPDLETAIAEAKAAMETKTPVTRQTLLQAEARLQLLAKNKEGLASGNVKLEEDVQKLKAVKTKIEEAMAEIENLKRDLGFIDNIHATLGEEIIQTIYQPPNVTQNDNTVLQRLEDAKKVLTDETLQLEKTLQLEDSEALLRSLKEKTATAIETMQRPAPS